MPGARSHADVLTAAMSEEPALASLLAMWGRRVVGDTLLVARAAVQHAGESPIDNQIEPVFTELIAAQTALIEIQRLTGQPLVATASEGNTP